MNGVLSYDSVLKNYNGPDKPRQMRSAQKKSKKK